MASLRRVRPVRLVLALAALAAAVFLAVDLAERGPAEEAGASAQAPASVERVGSTGAVRVRLSARAAERLGLETARVRLLGATGGGQPRPVIPYGAVLYDPSGATSAYVRVGPLLYARHRIRVLRIDGERAVLRSGPAAGAEVVTVGGAELLGIELGTGH